MSLGVFKLQQSETYRWSVISASRGSFYFLGLSLESVFAFTSCVEPPSSFIFSCLVPLPPFVMFLDKIPQTAASQPNVKLVEGVEFCKAESGSSLFVPDSNSSHSQTPWLKLPSGGRSGTVGDGPAGGTSSWQHGLCDVSFRQSCGSKLKERRQEEGQRPPPGSYFHPLKPREEQTNPL